MAVYFKLGKAWGVGLPWWLAPWLFIAWTMWICIYLCWFTLYWTFRGSVLAWKGIIYLCGSISRRQTDRLLPPK